MREKATVTFIDSTTTESYIVTGSFKSVAGSYTCLMENGSKVWLNRLEVRMIIISEEEE